MSTTQAEDISSLLRSESLFEDGIFDSLVLHPFLAHVVSSEIPVSRRGTIMQGKSVISHGFSQGL